MKYRANSPALRITANGILKTALYLNLLLTLVPAISERIPTAVHYLLLLVMFGFTFLGIFMQPQISGRQIILIFCSFFFSLLMYFGKWSATLDIVRAMKDLWGFWIILLLANEIIALSPEERYRASRVLWLLLALTCITTAIGLQSYPSASRVIATGSSLGNAYKRMNIGGYGFIYCLVVAVPYMVQGIFGSRHRWLYLGLLVLTFYVIVVSQYTIALMIALVVLALSVIFSSRNMLIPLLIFVIGILAVVFLRSFILDVLVSFQILMEKNGLKYVADRFGEIILLFSGDALSGDSLLRSTLYLDSFYAFLEHPFTGSLFADVVPGGHSELLDILGTTGMVGGLLFAGLIAAHIGNLNRIKGTDLYRNAWFSLLAFGMVCAINTVFNSHEIAAALFLFPVLLSGQESLPTGGGTELSHD